MLWILFALGAALSWGLYGPALHRGQVELGNPMRALLCVGVAYFLIGVLVPVITLDEESNAQRQRQKWFFAAAAGAAGGSRIRTALAHVFAATLLQGQSPDVATSSPRLHPVDRIAHVEPGYPDAGLDGLDEAGYEVRQWSDAHHFFGGASLLTSAGGGADPRRDGATLLL